MKRLSLWRFLLGIVILKTLLFGQPGKTILPGFIESPFFNEQIATFFYSPDIRVQINAPCAESFDEEKPVALVLYALPNGNTIEQTVGKILNLGDDWHYDIQHIGAQTRFLRQELPDVNLVVVYLETSQKSWPTWKRHHPNPEELIQNLSHYLLSLFQDYDPFIILAGHSGGGQFTFSFLDGISEIPDFVKRFLFLDSNYAYDHAYGRQMVHWLQAAEDHYLIVFAYNDSIVLYQGEPLLSPGGTWYQSKKMQQDLAQAFSFQSTYDEAFIHHVALNGRVQVILKKNPKQEILHTVQVERNGFIHGVLAGTPQENLTYNYYGERAYSSLIQEGEYRVKGFQIPPRSPEAMGGMEFMQTVMNASFEEREAAILAEISSGNLPDFLRNVKTIETSFTDANNQRHSVTYQVMPDYLAIGSDSDFCRIPMGPITAQKIADHFGATMPTRKLVDDIYAHAECKLEPITYPWSEESIKVPRFIQHHEDIETLRLAEGGELGQMMGGLKKDVVISNLIADPTRQNHVVIYGWHYLNGTPIQPLYNGHINSYVDYSHGIRLLNATVKVDHEEMDIKTLLQDPILYKLLSDEAGPMPQPTYLSEGILPEKPKSWGIKTETDGRIKILVNPDPSVDQYHVAISSDGITFQPEGSFSSKEYLLGPFMQDTLLYVKLWAENSIGMSNETEVLAVNIIQGEKPEILLVYGFDRPSSGNTFDFIRFHADAIKAGGRSFHSATNEAITDELFTLKDYYLMVDYILGEESTADETFSATEQQQVIDFLQTGGNFFVSGSEIAWDLDYKGNTSDREFFQNFLKARYSADAPGNVAGMYYHAEGLEGGLFERITDIAFDDGTHGTYNIKWADAVTAVNGGQPVLRYKSASTHNIGGISFEGHFSGGSLPGKSVYMGFPFETVYPEITRYHMMEKIIIYFSAEPSAISDGTPDIPLTYSLLQNYPNPFNMETHIEYCIPEDQWVTLAIFDLLGRKMATLVNTTQTKGFYTVKWDGHSTRGIPLSSGVYLYHLSAGPYTFIKKMILIK